MAVMDLAVPTLVLSLGFYAVGFVATMRGDQRLATLRFAPVLAACGIGGLLMISMATKEPLVAIPSAVLFALLFLIVVGRMRVQLRRATAGADSEEVERLDQEALNWTVLWIVVPLAGGVLLLLALLGYGLSRAIWA
jgi:hypothetical protein